MDKCFFMRFSLTKGNFKAGFHFTYVRVYQGLTRHILHRVSCKMILVGPWDDKWYGLIRIWNRLDHPKRDRHGSTLPSQAPNLFTHQNMCFAIEAILYSKLDNGGPLLRHYTVLMNGYMGDIFFAGFCYTYERVYGDLYREVVICGKRERIWN